MTLEEYLEFLDNNAVEYHTTDGSIVFKQCPSCQSDKDKVWLYKDRKWEDGPFFGKCLKCEEKFNSRSYLIAIGVDKKLVDDLHGQALEEMSLGIMPGISLFESKPPSEAAIDETAETDISNFSPLPLWADHPAAKYAVKRGWTPTQTDSILVDYMGNSVVFVVREGDQVVGYQRRLLKPRDPSLKTLSSRGFQKLKYTMEFPNTGDVCVCEGPFTALSAWHYGFHGICTFGCGVGEEQIKKIAQVAEATGKRVAVAFDLDDAGRRGYRRVSLSLLWRKVMTYRVRPEVGIDLNDSWMAGKGVVIIPDTEEDVSIPELSLFG